jgi:hypothetical protein
MHCIQQQPSLPLRIQTNRVHRNVPFLVLSMQPINVSRPRFESMVAIAYEEHPPLQMLQVLV